jgi:hypothetical protein
MSPKKIRARKGGNPNLALTQKSPFKEIKGLSYYAQF